MRFWDVAVVAVALAFSIGVPAAHAAEEMPDVRVTSVTSNFVPYESDATGSCIGPFLDLTFVVTNQGGDFPRPSDLQVNRSRMVDEPEATMLYFTLYADMDFGAGPGSGGQHVLEVDRSEILGGVLKKGGSVTVPLHLRVFDNQTSVRVSAKVNGAFLLKLFENKNQSAPFESGVLDIPIWDIYTESNAALEGNTEAGARTVDTKTTLINRGKSPTPGPVGGSFVIRYEDKAPPVLFKGKTPGPVGAGSNADILARTEVDKPLHRPFIVNSAIRLLCPNGEYGQLADGNNQDNVRTLKDQ